MGAQGLVEIKEFWRKREKNEGAGEGDREMPVRCRDPRRVLVSATSAPPLFFVLSSTTPAAPCPCPRMVSTSGPGGVRSRSSAQDGAQLDLAAWELWARSEHGTAVLWGGRDLVPSQGRVPRSPSRHRPGGQRGAGALRLRGAARRGPELQEGRAPEGPGGVSVPCRRVSWRLVWPCSLFFWTLPILLRAGACQ